MFSSPHERMHPFGVAPTTNVGGHRWRPNVEIAPGCPRCNSPDTKFCYYNNYSLTQPRYFCKGCRRYWTKGGSLRDVPVGGGCRKGRRAKSARLPAAPVIGSSDQSMQVPPAVSSGPAIDLPLIFAKFLNQCSEIDQDRQFVPELAPSGAGESCDLIGSMEGDVVLMEELNCPFDYDYECSVGMPAATATATAGVFEWQATTELLRQEDSCQFEDMGCDWSYVDQSSFGAF